MELQVAILSKESLPVRITVMLPTLEQSNSDLSNVNKVMPQLSVDPLFTSAGVMEADPEPSSQTLTS